MVVEMINVNYMYKYVIPLSIYLTLYYVCTNIYIYMYI